jgi:hypothetical protein
MMPKTILQTTFVAVVSAMENTLTPTSTLMMSAAIAVFKDPFKWQTVQLLVAPPVPFSVAYRMQSRRA